MLPLLLWQVGGEDGTFTSLVQAMTCGSQRRAPMKKPQKSQVAEHIGFISTSPQAASLGSWQKLQEKKLRPYQYLSRAVITLAQTCSSAHHILDVSMLAHSHPMEMYITLYFRHKHSESQEDIMLKFNSVTLWFKFGLPIYSIYGQLFGVWTS